MSPKLVNIRHMQVEPKVLVQTGMVMLLLIPLSPGFAPDGRTSRHACGKALVNGNGSAINIIPLSPGFAR